MSVLRRLHFYSGIRLDIPHIRALESSVSADFDAVLRGMVTGDSNPYILRGFDVIIPTAGTLASSLQIRVAGSAILHSTAAESGTILTVAAGAPNDILSASSERVLGAFQNNAINYVSLSLIRESDESTADETSGWSESQKIAYQRTVALGRLLKYRYIINTSGFSTNLPLYIVKTKESGEVEYITKCQPGLFRLGRGGTSPDPYYSFFLP